MQHNIAVRTSNCCTSAACCSPLSPSSTGLAASRAPPSFIRAYTRPPAPPATASSAPQAGGQGIFGLPAQSTSNTINGNPVGCGGGSDGCCCSLAMSPLGLILEFEMRWPSGTRMPLTMPPSATAPANTLQRSVDGGGRVGVHASRELGEGHKRSGCSKRQLQCRQESIT